MAELKNKIRTYLLILSPVLYLILTGCTAHTQITPVGRNNLDMHMSLGGPVVAAFGTNFPVPYLAGGARYGLNNRLNLNAGLHLLPLAYSISGLELGATWFPMLNEGGRPCLGLDGKLLCFLSFKAKVRERVRAYPVITPTAAWRLGKGTIYAGSHMIMLVFSAPDYRDDAERILFSPLVGYRLPLFKKTKIALELKAHGINVRTDQTAVNYLELGCYGALAPYISMEWGF